MATVGAKDFQLVVVGKAQALGRLSRPEQGILDTLAVEKAVSSLVFGGLLDKDKKKYARYENYNEAESANAGRFGELDNALRANGFVEAGPVDAIVDKNAPPWWEVALQAQSTPLPGAMSAGKFGAGYGKGGTLDADLQAVLDGKKDYENVIIPPDAPRDLSDKLRDVYDLVASLQMLDKRRDQSSRAIKDVRKQKLDALRALGGSV